MRFIESEAEQSFEAVLVQFLVWMCRV